MQRKISDKFKESKEQKPIYKHLLNDRNSILQHTTLFLDQSDQIKLGKLNHQFYRLFSTHYSQKSREKFGVLRNYSERFYPGNFFLDHSIVTLENKKIPGSGKKIITIQTLPNNTYLISYENGAIEIKDYKTDQLIKRLEEHKAPVTEITVLNKNRWASYSSDGAIRIWRNHGELECALQNQKVSNFAKILRNGQIVFIKETSIELQNPLYEDETFEIPLGYRPTRIDILPDGRLVVGKPYIEWTLHQGYINTWPRFEGIEIIDPKNPEAKELIPESRLGTVLDNGKMVIITCDDDEGGKAPGRRQGFRTLSVYNPKNKKNTLISSHHYYSGTLFDVFPLSQQHFALVNSSCYSGRSLPSVRIQIFHAESNKLVNEIRLELDPKLQDSRRIYPVDIIKMSALADGNLVAFTNDGIPRMVIFPEKKPVIKKDTLLTPW